MAGEQEDLTPAATPATRPAPDARPGVRELLLLLALLAVVAAFKLVFTANTYTTNIDGGFYTNVARHVRDGYGLSTEVSLYHKAYAYFPHPTSVYPLWPLLHGTLARVFPIFEVGRWAPTALYFVALVAAWAWARRVWPGDLFARVPGLGAGHVAVLLFALNLNFFRFTSFPYTEGLAYALLLAGLWRFVELWPRPGVRAGLELGVWLAAIMLARSQLVILAIAAFSVLALALAVGPTRRDHAWMAGAALLAFVAVLAPYLAWVRGSIPDAGPMTLLRFDQARPNDLLAPIDAFAAVDSPLDRLWDFAAGVPVAYSPVHRYAYQHTFHGFQYAVPLALPFLLADAARRVAGTPWRELLRRWCSRERLNLLFVIVFALGGFVSIHLVHKIAWAEWNFGKRQALTCTFLFLACLLYLLRHRRPLPFALGVVLLVGAGSRGLESIATTTAELVARSPSPKVYKRKLVDWLHRARGPKGSVIVVSPPGVTQRLSAYTEGVYYHWINQRTSHDDVLRLFEERGAQYLILPAAAPGDWRVTADEAAFAGEFEVVEARVAGMRIFARRGHAPGRVEIGYPPAQEDPADPPP